MAGNASPRMSDDVIIRVENLGKKYRIKHQAERQRYTALRDVITDHARNLFRRNGRGGNPKSEHLTSDIGPLTSGSRSSHEDFWALRNINFEVEKGEVLGIIGRNGAGKTTLLKILSRITDPAEGRVRIRGRVASLLEVGTGFHPELTGRENIFLNGAILGMSRSEIKSRFDEIVAFAEIEKFLDTPVKRYSSGMYVRLAFAVAAHLDPEILLVDEVLAVGDAEFQRKCLGKMREVSKGGRTVLFVSHNMAAVRSLTSRGLVLNEGEMVFEGKTDAAIEHYAQLGSQGDPQPTICGRGMHTTLLAAQLLDDEGKPTRYYMPGTPLRLEVILKTDGTSSLSLEAFLLDSTRHKLGLTSLHQFHGRTLPTQAGRYRTVMELMPMWLAAGTYSFDVTTSIVNTNWDHYVESIFEFDVIYSNPGGQSWNFKHSMGFGAFAMPARVEPRFEVL